jgi:hypothetical protein
VTSDVLTWLLKGLWGWGELEDKKQPPPFHFGCRICNEFFVCLFLFFCGMRFELSALHLLDRCSTA